MNGQQIGLVMVAMTAMFVLACDGGTTEAGQSPLDGVLIGGEPREGHSGPSSGEPGESSLDFGGPGAAVALPDVWGHTPLADVNPASDIVEVFITAQEKMMELREGLWVSMYTYNGMFPGPLLQATVGDRVIVHFQNDLPEATTIHWHGLAIANAMDGTPRVQDPVEPGETFVYDFVVPDAGSFWYHPHMNTNEQLEKGLYAPLVVQETEPPDVDAERYFMLDDILIDNNGDFYPFLEQHFEKMHGRHGNMLLTNGSADIVPGIAVQGQVERWRLVTSANARTMDLSIEGASWRIVGTDGGLIEEPYTTDRLSLPVGQRYDIEVSYNQSGPAQLVSHVMALDENDNLITIPVVLATINVAASDAPLRVVQWPEVEPLPEREIDQAVWVELDVTNDPVHGVTWMINGDAMPMEPLWIFPEGATVQMQIFNRAGPEHPFHLHGQFFEILRRNGVEVFDEPGKKDIVLVPGFESVHIKAYMDNPGDWMAHCHIAGHAELGMMAAFIVGDPTGYVHNHEEECDEDSEEHSLPY